MKKHIFVTSWSMLMGVCFSMLLSYSVFIFLSFKSADFTILEKTIYTFFTFVLPTIIPFTNAQRWFTVTKLDKSGVSQWLFGFIRIRMIKWEEIEQIYFKIYVGSWIFFSTGIIDNRFYNDIVKLKGVIQCCFSKKLVLAIREYINIKIIGIDNLE